MPELHVVGAGSLLDFVLSEENSKMPVGRIQYLFMKPLSFLEFLDAAGENRSREIIENIGWDSPVNPVVHDHLLSLVKKYAIVGGMPKATVEYVSSGDLNRCHRIQTSIIQTYRDEFEEPSLYYWAREARSSNAELDFLVPCLSYALPVEVKAGKTGTLRSMHLFLDKYPCPVGVRVSRLPFSDNPPIISVPFYGIKKIPKMVKHHF